MASTSIDWIHSQSMRRKENKREERKALRKEQKSFAFMKISLSMSLSENWREIDASNWSGCRRGLWHASSSKRGCVQQACHSTQSSERQSSTQQPSICIKISAILFLLVFDWIIAPKKIHPHRRNCISNVNWKIFAAYPRPDFLLFFSLSCARAVAPSGRQKKAFSVIEWELMWEWKQFAPLRRLISARRIIWEIFYGPRGRGE